jgi:hypothetical protein
MGNWLVVVVPAFLAALLIRFDARYTGPYFPLSALVVGSEGLLAFIDDKQRRAALFRRFAYPIVMGYVLSDFNASIWDSTVAGLLVAVLLLWPMVFHGVDASIIDRGWRLVLLYSSFTVLFAAFSSVGHILSSLVATYRSGGTVAYLLSQLPFVIIWPLVTAICLASFRFFAGKVRQRVTDAWREQTESPKEASDGDDLVGGSTTIDNHELGLSEPSGEAARLRSI